MGPGAYSRFVALLKFALPLAGLVLLAAIFLVQDDGQAEGGIVFSPADKAAIDEGLTIRDPRFSGISRDGNRFTVTAVSALPDGPKAKRLSLVGVQGRSEAVGGSVLELRAAKGEADLASQVLVLEGGIHISISQGYVVTAPSARADMAAGVITMDGPVATTGPLGKIEAGGARLAILRDERGKAVENQLITFENGVKMTIPPADRRSSPE